MATINLQELRRQYELLGPRKVCKHLEENIDQGKLRCQDFSIRDLFEALIPDGPELLRAISMRKSGGMSLVEAAAAVDTSAFANITGQIVFNRVKERYQDPEFLWPQLFEQTQTAFLNGELIPGIGRIGDKAEVVDEGQPYPTVGLTEEYIQTKPLVKRGFIVPVTREIIVADRTGILLREAGEQAYWEGLNTEKRALKVALGVTNNYKRNGTATNTYLTSGAYINSAANTLVDWTDIENAELLFDALTDPNTGELISVAADTLIVPTALKRTANRILTASEIAHVDNQVAANTVRTFSPNPYGGSAYKILSTSHVKEATSSAAKWYFGQPKRAFLRLYAWDIETSQAADNNQAKFQQDIWAQFKVSVMDHFQTVEPRFMVEST